MLEKPAKGVRGFLLYNPFDDRHFFRIYDKENKRKFKDYAISIEDLEIEILASGASLMEYQPDEQPGIYPNVIDWSSSVYSKARKAQEKKQEDL